ncbi:5500_t:CDS:2 [Ambispora leptoticha]|uniref:5500_t:CDS:1 n=1 Tax=Ambispora leptoticha TaxID=144679 RepID=A0A9N8VW80_9GLOM|nr:5500_t:CDS:2 [Ambispora leptoticha]
MSSKNLISTNLKEQSEYAKSVFRDNLKGLDAFTRHKKFINDYVRFYGRKHEATTLDSTETKTEFDILKENHKFLRSEAEDEQELTWEQRVAKKYYDKLFKEYCIVELKYYKEGKIALRWRIEKEVMSGKGQFECASTRCSESNGLKSWEVNFAYMEDGEKKNALVKIRLCPKCSEKLNYRNKYKAAIAATQEPMQKEEKRKIKSDKKHHKRNYSESEEESEEESDSDEDESQDERLSKSGSSRKRLKLEGKRSSRKEIHHKRDKNHSQKSDKREQQKKSSPVHHDKSSSEDEFFAGLFN